MIRFIDLRGQVNNDADPHFAFYDTERDRFLEFSGVQDWTSVADFGHDMALAGDSAPEGIDARCLALIPKNYFRAQDLRLQELTAQATGIIVAAYLAGEKAGGRLALTKTSALIAIDDSICRSATYSYMRDWLDTWRRDDGSPCSPVACLDITSTGIKLDYSADADQVDTERVDERATGYRDGYFAGVEASRSKLRL